MDLEELEDSLVCILIGYFLCLLKSLGNISDSRWVRHRVFHIFNSVDSRKGAGKSSVEHINERLYIRFTPILFDDLGRK